MQSLVDFILAADVYKMGHPYQYPEGLQFLYANFTPRHGKYRNLPQANDGHDDEVVFFGLQYFIMRYLKELADETFFNLGEDEVREMYKLRMKEILAKPDANVEHIVNLWKLGYLPLEIKALDEGTRVPYGVPVLTVENTVMGFGWFAEYVEDVISAVLWKMSTSATTADWYKRVMLQYAGWTGADKFFTNFQGHDFSLRGMSGIEDGAQSGAAHLLSFLGSDNVPGMELLRKYYTRPNQNVMYGCSVDATEHSVATANILSDPVFLVNGNLRGAETNYIKRMITEVVPSGIVSIVADSFDFWAVITEDMPYLKNLILARDGKVVVRPDSGDPVKIICGDPDADTEWERKGAVECLWDIFSGTINERRFKVLDSHIGLIYGDSISPTRLINILAGLEKKGFASSSVVFGIGSYTYNYVTRDTHGWAVKATACIINNREIELYKDPKTDSKKRSARGYLAVVMGDNGKLELVSGLTSEEEIHIRDNLLKTRFKNGVVYNDTDVEEIRKKLSETI